MALLYLCVNNTVKILIFFFWFDELASATRPPLHPVCRATRKETTDESTLSEPYPKCYSG